jgi:hypothetical protein
MIPCWESGELTENISILGEKVAIFIQLLLKMHTSVPMSKLLQQPQQKLPSQPFKSVPLDVEGAGVKMRWN